MKILVINCGSSSLKYQLFDMEDRSVLAKGLAERIGIEGSVLTHKPTGKDNAVYQQPMKDHKDALRILMDALIDPKCGVIKDMSEITAVGHRVVHAGEKFASSVKLTDEVVQALEDCVPLAPLHNPPNLMGIEACKAILGDTPMVGVFDTAFHQTMPDYAYIYPLPYEYYEKYGVRKYGFHGTSHRYVSQRAAAMLKKDIKDIKIITCHLGNGSSIAAVDCGKSVETTMGFTPLDGLAMGTRCGTIDPAIVTFLMQKENLSVKEIDSIMNKKSGVFGVSGVSSDFRDIETAANEGNKRASLALKIFTYRVKYTIGQYAAAMGGVDAVVFTAGIGENSKTIREACLENLEFMGIKLDKELNDQRGKEAFICAKDSRVAVLLIPTDEELMIAVDTKEIIEA